MTELSQLFEELENSLRVCHNKFTENCKICTLVRDEVSDFKEAHKGWAEEKAVGIEVETEFKATSWAEAMSNAGRKEKIVIKAVPMEEFE